MPVIQLHDQKYPLQRGPTRLGSGPDADVRVGDDAWMGVQAVLDLGSDDQAVIRRAGERGTVKVNGFALGAEPIPLMHGDKIEVSGVELLFSDDKKAGATGHVMGSEIAAMAAARGGPPWATTSTGGRLVSLVDGKEYAIPETGVGLGRDASNDVVVSQNAVSRYHARIEPEESGYVITDRSTNGVFVNGRRVEGRALLGRADVIRIGTEEFRFYADVASLAYPPAPAVPLLPPRPAPAPLSQEPATLPTPVPAPQPLAATTGEPGARPVLATLEILKEGPNKGQRIELRDALSHVGRGAHNDVALGDDSVSDSHARLQLRDDGWYVVDAGSTNGTFVGGVRISGERRLEGTPDIRFGGVRVRFFPAQVASMAAAGTRRVSLGSLDDVAPTAARKRRIPTWVWIVVALVIVTIVVIFLMNG